MEKIPLPKSFKQIKEEGNSYVFVLEPLYPGYGATIGNALRRILLSSLPGAAVTAVKVKGVDHEFSTIKSVKEDMVEIILNLKQLRLKSFSENPVRLTLKAKGDKPVTAEAISKSDQVEIANPGLHIATLDGKNSELEMELVVEQGRGYVPVESREEERNEIGMIAIDAIFSPVRMVSYEVENVRVGKMTNFDKLTLSLTTNGTISGMEAITKSAEIAVEHFRVLLGESMVESPVLQPQETVERETESAAPDVGESLSAAGGDDLLSLNLSRRAYNALLKNNVTNILELKNVTKEQLENMQGVGEKSMKEIMEAIDLVKTM